MHYNGEMHCNGLHYIGLHYINSNFIHPPVNKIVKYNDNLKKTKNFNLVLE